MELWTALILGAAGSLHCAGMCGPLVLALPRSADGAARWAVRRAAHNFGRLATYSLMGAIAGSLGQAAASAGLQRGLSVAAGAAILLGLALHGRLGFANRTLSKAVARLKSALAKRLSGSSVGAFWSVGLLNGLLPCGLVYFACAGAASTGSAVGGLLYMLCFGVGTVPLMFLISLSGTLVGRGAMRGFQRLAPLWVFAVGAMLIARGLSLGIPYLSPDLTPPAEGEAPSSCCASGLPSD